MSFAPVSFGRFTQSTGLTVFSGPRDIVVDCQDTNYEMLGYMSRGQPMDKILQGGSKIYDKILLEVTRRTSSHQMNEPRAYQITNNSRTWEVEWRFFLTDFAYPEEALILNAGSDAEALSQMYKDYWHEIQQDMYVDACNYWESQFWAVPDASKMEAKTGKDMYSVAAGLNEFPDGLPQAVGQPGGAWTTHQLIDPTTTATERWKPTIVKYGTDSTGSGAGFLPDRLGNVISALDVGMEATNFKTPPLKKEFFTAQAPYPIGFIACSLEGKRRIKHLYRAENDHWANMNDPWGAPMINNAPIVYCAALDNAAIYPTGALDALSTELDTANVTHGLTTLDHSGTGFTVGHAGPRYYGIQPSMLRMVWHKNRFMEPVGEGGPLRDLEFPTTPVMLFQTFGNLIFRSRRRHFELVPDSDHA